jgi:ornithine carbamoyltransferase
MGKRNLVSAVDFSAEEVWALFRLAAAMKADPSAYSEALKCHTAALVFEKPSLRTRVTFEVGMFSMGGHAIYLAPGDIRIGERESVEDVARNLERWVQVIVARTFAHETVVCLAQNAVIPVINALSDAEHPCQALADLFTLYEKWGDTRERKLAYVGDGNNTCVSLLLLVSGLGGKIAVATPTDFAPPVSVVENAKRRASQSGAEIALMEDPREAVRGADAVYTDTWVSMGQEEEKEERLRVFHRYQVNRELMEEAAEDAVFMHCLPAYRGEEVTDDVIDGPQSLVFDQAENRLHIQKAILHTLMLGK